jgi:hypothetical protein
VGIPLANVRYAELRLCDIGRDWRGNSLAAEESVGICKPTNF